MTRDELIERHMPIVRRIVGTFQRGGIPPQVEAADLEAEGYLALVKAIEGYRGEAEMLEGRVVRNVRTALVAHIRREAKHWRGRSNWEDAFDGKGDPRV